MRDGEINLLGGLRQTQDSTTLTGIPGLSSIPVISWLFSNKTVTKSSQELLIALIPHIVRRPDYTEENLKGIAVGNATTVKLNYAQPAPAEEPAKAAAPGAPGPPAAAGATPAISLPATAPVRNPAALNFVPNAQDISLGGEFKVNLAIQNIADLFGAPLTIKFDPKMLRLNEVTPGTLLSIDGKQVNFTKNVQNDTGEASVSLTRFPGSGGVTSAGNLLTLSFTAISRGNSSVMVQGFTPTNSKGQPLPSSSPVLPVTIK